MSISVNMHNSAISRVDVLSCGTAVVHVGEYPVSVAIFVPNGIGGVAEWIGTLAEKVSEHYAKNIESSMSN